METVLGRSRKSDDGAEEVVKKQTRKEQILKVLGRIKTSECSQIGG